MWFGNIFRNLDGNANTIKMKVQYTEIFANKNLTCKDYVVQGTNVTKQDI